MMDFISPAARQYKANLHSHSTLSDGLLPPEKLIQAYRERGYSILAITDHEAPYDHTAASTPEFLLFTGYEAYIRPSPDYAMDPYGPEIHMNLLAKDPHNTTFINFDPNGCRYMPKELADQREKAADLGPRRYSREHIQRFINAARENGYLVTYNHPVWSMEDQEDILSYRGFFSLEVFNAGCMTVNGQECNMALYDAMLRRGNLVYCHGADDNHNSRPLDDYLSDSFGAWTMVLAGELTYPAVVRALEQGRFYASTGPSITCLSFDGKKVHMEFTAASRAMMHMSPKRAVSVCNHDGSPITQADFVIPDDAPYVYFSVRTAEGKQACVHAFTRADLGI